MKRIFRVFLIESVALFLVSKITTGLDFEKGLQSLVIAGVALGIAAFFVRPVINILILPLNLLTFGIFKFLTNAITLYLVDLVLKEFNVGGYHFLGLKQSLIDIPSFGVPYPLSYIAFSFTISFITSILYWFVN
ncbi:MAG TPA: phage holin family protein [Patescibacteria group bacterium]